VGMQVDMTAEVSSSILYFDCFREAFLEDGAVVQARPGNNPATYLCTYAVVTSDFSTHYQDD